MNTDFLDQAVELKEHIEASNASDIVDSRIDKDMLNIEIKKESALAFFSFLRDDSMCRFVCIVDICGVDFPERENRFNVVYHFLSPSLNQRIRVVIKTDEQSPVQSICDIYPGALWFEREAYDLYGIFFENHPDLRRLLTDYGFRGYPLRKDFPLTGFHEVRYDDNLKRVVYEPVKLAQEFRQFDYLSPWEGPDYILPGDEKATEQ